LLEADMTKPTHSFLAHLWVLLWGAFAVALALLAILYAVIGFVSSGRDVIGWARDIGIILLLILLFYGEGSDVAVARLYDRDPEQLIKSHPEQAELLKALQQSESGDLFIVGRQLIVVSAIVVITMLVDNLADVSNLTAGPLTSTARAIGPAHAIFSLVFTTFVALWFSQLPSKFIAHERPLTVFKWYATMNLIRLSRFIGRFRGISITSTFVRDRILMFPWNRNVYALLPSRRSYYEAAASFGDGKGIEEMHLVIMIDKDGSLSVRERIRFHAYSQNFKDFTRKVAWQARIRDNASTITTMSKPEHVVDSFQRPCFDGVEQKDSGDFYWLRWGFWLNEPLNVGEEIVIESHYETEPGGTKHLLGETDQITYRTSKAPVAAFTLDVHPAVGAPFVFMGAEGSAEVSDSEHVNSQEAERIIPSGFSDGGYRFMLPYPQIGAIYKFSWRIMEPPKALPA
jgi:hypothetical protein